MDIEEQEYIKYYNKKQVDKIYSLEWEYKFHQAEAEYIAYLEKFPMDYFAWARYIDTLIKLSKLEEAEYALNNVILKNNISKMARQEFTAVKIKLLCCQKKYLECYNLLNDNYIIFYNRKDFPSTSVYLFLRKKLHILDKEKCPEEGYLVNQVIEYSEEAAFDHLTKHQYAPDNDNEAQFVEGFPLKAVYHQIREMIPTCVGYHSGVIDTKYTFKYDYNGYAKGKLTNYLQATVLNDSTDIITMYPFPNTGHLPYTDITPAIEEKVKKISRIDKFNQKYGLNS